MMHREIEDQEIIERYVRHELAPEERQAFEEHFFACDECFERVQTTERFVAGVHDAGRGLLGDSHPGDAVPARSWGAWMLPALAGSSCVAIALSVVAGWTLFFQMPKLRQQLNQASADVSAQRDAISALQRQIASSTQAEANVPLVMLQATRDAQASASEAVLPEGTARLVLWVEVAASNVRSFRLQVETENHRPVVTLDHLQRNSYGALAASLPAERLQPGDYRIRLSRQEPLPVSLLEEFRLRIRRP